MKIELEKGFYDSVLIQHFFEVNAPDVLIKEAFWYDENDNPVTSKADEEIILKNGGIVKKTDWLRTNQKRDALDSNDFAEIYEREFLSSKLLDTKIHHKVFKDQLTKYVNKLIAYHEDNREYGRTLDIEIIAKANEFLSWLPNYEMPPLVIDGILFNAELVYQIHKQYNNILFFNLSEKQLFDALNNPKEFGGLIKMKLDNKGKLTGLIKHLEDLCKSKEWKKQIIEKIEDIDIGFYQRKSKKEALSIKLD